MENSKQPPDPVPNSSRSAEIHQLLTGLMEGKLTDDQFRSLEAILADDPQARAEYHRQLQMHTLLMYGHQHDAESVQSAEHRQLGSADEFAKYVYQASNQASWQGELQHDATINRNSQQENSPPAIPDLSPIPGLGEESPSTIRAFLPWLTGGILGIALTAVVVVSWVLPRPHRDPEVVGAFTGLPSVHILSGTTKLLLPNIGQVVIDGPAEFDMLDPMRARLSRGRLNFRVTEETGRGFVVETPYGNVKDLGTEFGLDLSKEGQAGLVVFDGAVDLQVQGPSTDEKPIVERLTQGDGVLFDKEGAVNPIGAIRRDGMQSFELCSDAVTNGQEQSATIVNVTDSLRETGSRKFYEIVSGGLRTDALVYVDRFFTFKKLPAELSFLEGADYVKMFNDDRYYEDLKVSVTLSRPAKLYVIFDSRLNVPEWLSRDFRELPEKIWYGGSNTRTSTFRFTTGFSVWERVVKEPAAVELGYCYAAGRHRSPRVAMYSIAAVPIQPSDKAGVDFGSIGFHRLAYEDRNEVVSSFSITSEAPHQMVRAMFSWMTAK